MIINFLSLFIFIIIFIFSISLFVFFSKPSVIKNSLISVIGSGGHTHEMLMLIQSIIIDDRLFFSPIINKITFIISKNDKLSKEKLNLKLGIWKYQAKNNEQIEYDCYEIQRSRQVQQSYFTSILTTLIAFYHSYKIIYKEKPSLLLCNGPGVCIPVILVTKLFSPQTKIVFIESFCRTKTLSLTGKIIYYANLANYFIVQWPKLKAQYRNAKFMGILV